jgi:hypothetical protein
VSASKKSLYRYFIKIKNRLKISAAGQNSKIWADFIAASVQENFCLVFSIASSVTKILANKIVSLYSIFSQKFCICIALNDTFLSIAAHLWM